MVNGSLPSPEWLRERPADAEPDLLREMMRMAVAALMGAGADEPCGAGGGAQPRSGSTAADTMMPACAEHGGRHG